MTAKERLVKAYVSLIKAEKITIDKVPTVLKEDVENLIYNILNENFEEVLPEEIIDIKK